MVMQGPGRAETGLHVKYRSLYCAQSEPAASPDRFIMKCGSNVSPVRIITVNEPGIVLGFLNRVLML
jgi:hypothetical protein